LKRKEFLKYIFENGRISLTINEAAMTNFDLFLKCEKIFERKYWNQKDV
jgi:hypothetical protein